MDIRYHKHFDKAFGKLSQKIKKKVRKAIDIFYDNPHESQLDNHALHGKQKDRRVISARGDIRIVFVEKNNYEIVEFLNVGTHSQVY
jgi:addiction module RelE/StbE family toxin